MYRTKKTQRLALVLALTLALALPLIGAPQALAGPSAGSVDLGGAVYSWLAGLWSSLSAVLDPSESEDDLGPMLIPNGLNSQPTEELGPMQIPNG